MSALMVALAFVVGFGLGAGLVAARAAVRTLAQAPRPSSAARHFPQPSKPPVDPGKQALAMLQRGDDCDWYSIDHTNEPHEAFDSLEIYWRTMVEHPDQNALRYGRGPFELKAGFRVRWRVAGTHHSYVEAVGLDLLTTILEAREEADRLIDRVRIAAEMGQKHPALEAWREGGEKRKYSFHGLSPEKWFVSIEYPGGMHWAEHQELDQAVADVLGRAGVSSS